MTQDNIETVAEGHPMDFLLSEDVFIPAAGEIREGWVVKNHKNEILIDIGAKSEGFLSQQELDGLNAASREALAEGNQVSVYIIDPEDQKGNLILSYTQALEEREWLDIIEHQKNQTVCKCKVLGSNRGGLLVEIGQLRGFLPKSQLQRQHQNNADLNTLMGKTLTTKVIEADRDQQRIILSERAAMKEVRAAKRKELFKTLKEGDKSEGTVVHIADFGAFVDIGGVEGLVHVSELSWKRISHPSEVLKVGETIPVSILRIDKEKQRLALSVKKLEPNPWSMLSELYTVGQLVEATVTKVTPYGAFARINDDNGLIGLIHISEMSDERVEHPREIIKTSEVVAVRIIRINPEQRQIGLSIKQVSSDKYLEADMKLMGSENTEIEEEADVSESVEEVEEVSVEEQNESVVDETSETS